MRRRSRRLVPPRPPHLFQLGSISKVLTGLILPTRSRPGACASPYLYSNLGLGLPPVGAAVVTACGGFARARELARALDDRLVLAAGR